MNAYRLSQNQLKLATAAAMLVASGCYVAPGLDPVITPQPVVQLGTEGVPQQIGPIEAGCSFNSTQLQGGVGQVFQVACPPGCEQTGGLWGTDVYTGDSTICGAAIHAGAIPRTGGVVSVQIQPGRPAYRGSIRYGVQSYDYGQYGSSFQVLLPQGQQPAAAVAPQQPAGVAPQPAVATVPQAIEAGCSFNATQIQDALGTAHLVSCPAGCGGQGGLWGTDVYTGDSAICSAAVHAGLIQPNGGYVVVVLEQGRPAYRGSTRYGIQSHDYGSYRISFRLQRP